MEPRVREPGVREPGAREPGAREPDEIVANINLQINLQAKN